MPVSGRVAVRTKTPEKSGLLCASAGEKLTVNSQNAIKDHHMKRTQEVSRWRMLRQIRRRRTRWLEGQSRRYSQIHSIRHQLRQQHRRSVLFINEF